MVTTYRYPTEKAYGITTAYTCQALKELNIEISHYVPGFISGNDQLGMKYFGLKERKFVGNQKRFSRSRHHLNQVLISLRFILVRNTLDDFDLIWTRSPHLVFLIRLFGVKTATFLEIHDSRIYLDRLCVRFFAKSSKAFFGVISQSAFQDFSRYITSKNLVKIPMAAPKDFFGLERQGQHFQNVGFAGKSTTNGLSNNLEMLVAALEMTSGSKELFSLDFVGVETNFRDDTLARLSINPSLFARIKFVPQMTHRDLIKYLLKFDIGVIPYSDSEFNRERFPLKLIEFAAAKIPIMLSDIPSHRELIPEDCVTYFSPNAQEFLRQLAFMREHPMLISDKVDRAHNWSKNYTYENRVRCVVNLVSLR